MAGLVPAIHVKPSTRNDVDARAFASPKRLRPRRRDKPGHDGGERARIIHTLGLWAPAYAVFGALPLPLLADHPFGDHRINIAVGVAELGKHLAGVLAEFRWGAAQARPGAVEADRRGHALVPILLDHIAAVDGVRIGQRLVDLLHWTRRQPRGEQAVAERLGFMLRKHRGELGTQRLAVGDAVLVAGKARIGAELGLADLLTKLAEG